MHVADDAAGWRIVVEGSEPIHRRVEETLFTLADGWFGTRGALEDLPPGSTPLVLAGGTYVRGRDTEGVGRTPELLAGPIWTGLDLQPAPGASMRRTLDLRRGTLVREEWCRQDEEEPCLRVVRFVCLARPGTVVLRAEGRPDRLAAGPALSVPPHDPTARVGQDGSRWWASTGSRRGWLAAVAVSDTSEDDPDRRVVERRTVLRRGRGTPPGYRDAWTALEAAATVPFERLLAEQRRAWASRWHEADIRIEGDDEMQLAVRFAMFHLMASVPDRGEAAVGARGLTGTGYRGHVFWDADVFVLPFLAATHPRAARAMLAYRVARLPAARRAAAALGRDGARFPWESADDGDEVTPSSVIGIEGRPVEILTGRYEEHITADVAWAAAHYLDWTRDRAFERGDGRRLLRATARYWASRLAYGADGRAHLHGVMGPDEYHAPVDDNAFTNGMARWNLRRAAATVAPSGSPQLRREADAWRRAADALVDGYDEQVGRHEQFAGFSDLEPLRIADLASPPVPADILLGSELVARSQVVKQADVIMLHHLLPEHVPQGSLVRDLEHYLPRTAHGSSLSPGVHACQLARAGRADDALALLRLTAQIDLDDSTGSTAAGIHLAAAGSLWQAVVYGLFGLWPDGDALGVAPRLPSTWTSLTVRVSWRGVPLQLRAEHDHLEVRSTRPVRITLRGEPLVVSAPVATFRLPGHGEVPPRRSPAARARR